jgi:hypothetical protein
MEAIVLVPLLQLVQDEIPSPVLPQPLLPLLHVLSVLLKRRHCLLRQPILLQVLAITKPIINFKAKPTNNDVQPANEDEWRTKPIQKPKPESRNSGKNEKKLRINSKAGQNLLQWLQHLLLQSRYQNQRKNPSKKKILGKFLFYN